MEQLDPVQILSALSQQNFQLLGKFLTFPSVDSTNRYLLEHANDLPSLSICLAQEQTAGRGRRGKQWQSPASGNIYLSLLQHYDCFSTELSGLSIAVGINIIQVLEKLSIFNVGLKWPNDLLWHGRKLGGILIESKMDGHRCSMVVGIGINCFLAGYQMQLVDQPWVDLSTIQKGVSRNQLISMIIEQLIPILDDFPKKGLKDYIDVWSRYNINAGKTVTIQKDDVLIDGVDVGIDESGALLLLRNGKIETIYAGEVSLRGT